MPDEPAIESPIVPHSETMKDPLSIGTGEGDELEDEDGSTEAHEETHQTKKSSKPPPSLIPLKVAKATDMVYDGKMAYHGSIDANRVGEYGSNHGGPWLSVHQRTSPFSRVGRTY